jgi:hypothetical protein
MSVEYSNHFNRRAARGNPERNPNYESRNDRSSGDDSSFALGKALISLFHKKGLTALLARIC